MDIIDGLIRHGDTLGLSLLTSALLVAVGVLWRHSVRQAAVIAEIQNRRIADMRAANEAKVALLERVLPALESASRMNAVAIDILRGRNDR